MIEEYTNVSVVIPYSADHTSEKMLKEAIDSVNEQRVPTTIHIIRDVDNNGPSWARNIGIRRSKSDYVAFLDADDRWAPGKLEKQVSLLNETGSGICVEAQEGMSEDTFIRQLFLGNVQSVTSSVLVDKRIVDCTFDEGLERREDHLFVLEAAAEAGICFCSNIVHIRKHKGGLSSETSLRLRLSQDLKFSRKVGREVPDVVKSLNEFYDRPHESDSGITNTLGDAFRTMCCGAGILTVANVFMSSLLALRG